MYPSGGGQGSGGFGGYPGQPPQSGKCIFRAQSFTSLKEDLHQGINRGFAFSRYLNGTFP